jgi:sec-independent protein translocase protein TatA
MNLGGPELLIVFAIIMLVFGARKLPELARSMGQAKKEFEHGTREPTRRETTGTDA